MSTHHGKPFVKVCGQTSAASTEAALSLGAGFIGFIFHSSSPRAISPVRAAGIRTHLARRVGVFVRQDAAEILSIMQQANLHYAQLHGRQSIEDACRIGARRVIRVLWPQACLSLAELQSQLDAWAPYCAYYLLDAGKSPGVGGSGKTLDVAQLAQLRIPRPWFLAGGLSAASLPQILAHCRPDGIDLNSGVELAPGLKHASLILSALRSIRHPKADGAGGDMPQG